MSAMNPCTLRIRSPMPANCKGIARLTFKKLASVDLSRLELDRDDMAKRLLQQLGRDSYRRTHIEDG